MDLTEIEQILTLIGGVKGASTLAIVATGVQAAMLIVKSDEFTKLLPNLSGAVKLSIVSGLTLVGTIVGQMSISGATFLSALTQGVVLSALAVFANQLIQEFAPSAATTVSTVAGEVAAVAGDIAAPTTPEAK